MIGFDGMIVTKKVGLIALEKSVPRTYRIFCHPAHYNDIPLPSFLSLSNSTFPLLKYYILIIIIAKFFRFVLIF